MGTPWCSGVLRHDRFLDHLRLGRVCLPVGHDRGVRLHRQGLHGGLPDRDRRAIGPRRGRREREGARWRCGTRSRSPAASARPTSTTLSHRLVPLWHTLRCHSAAATGTLRYVGARCPRREGSPGRNPSTKSTVLGIWSRREESRPHVPADRPDGRWRLGGPSGRTVRLGRARCKVDRCALLSGDGRSPLVRHVRRDVPLPVVRRREGV